MASMQWKPNRSGVVSFERSGRVGPESQTGWPETHSLNFNEQKRSKSMFLNAEAVGENGGMHRAKQQNLDSAGEGKRAQRVSGSVQCKLGEKIS